MRPSLRLSALALSALSLAPSAEADDPDTRELLAAARAALGPADRLADLDAVLVTGEYRWGGMDGAGKFERRILSDGRASQRITYKTWGEFDMVSDGTLVWDVSPIGVDVRAGWNAAQFRRAFLWDLPGAWLTAYGHHTLVGRETLDGRDCWVLDLRPAVPADADRDVVPPLDTVWLDAETHLPAQVVLRLQADREAPSVITCRYDAWTEPEGLGGVRFATEQRVELSDFVQTVVVDGVEPLGTIDESWFERGEDVQAAIDAKLSGADTLADGEIRLEELQAQHIASVRVTAPHADMQKTLAVILPEALRHVMSAGVRMEGQPLVRYHNFGDVLDVEGAIPVVEAVEEGGRVKAETLPAGPALVTWHVGPYDQLGDTHTRVLEHMAAEGLESSSAPWEQYWTDPGMEPDPSKWRTLVVYPVRPVREG